MTSAVFDWFSLKTRLTLITLAVFVLGIWALTFYASSALREDMERLLSDQQFSTVSLLASQANQELEARLKVLEGIARHITPALLGNTVALQEHLEQRETLQTLFNGGAYVTSIDGTAAASLPLGNSSHRDAQYWWLTATIEMKPLI